MSKPTPKRKVTLRTLVVIFGVALLAWLVQRVGFQEIIKNFSRLGWGLILVLALGGASHLVKTLAWRLTLTGWRRGVSFRRMLQLRLVSEAVGQVGVLGQLFGEGLRVSALSPKIPVESRILSVTLDRALFIATAAMVSLVGIVAALPVLSLTHALRLYAVLFALVLISLLALVALTMLRRWPLVSRSAQALGRLRFLSDRVEAMLPLIRSVENGLFEFHRGTPRAFWASLALNLTCHGVAVLEVYLVLWLLGVKVGLVAALVFEALTKLVNVVGTVNPGNIGTYEGGNVLIARMFGLNGAIGFAVAGTRRIRALFWAAVGVICLIILSRTRGYSDSESNTSGDIGEGAASGIESQGTGQSLTAVILANNSKECGRRDFPQDRVGTLPVLLRDILSAEKAGARRIIVCVDPVAKPYLQRELRATERLPRSIEWFTAGSDTSLHQLLTQIATEPGEGYLLLATGNRTYHPTLFQRASEWSGERGALALTCEDQLVGIYLLSANCLFHVAGHGPREIRNIEELHVWLVLNDSVECEAVPNALWQRVSIPGGRIAAERKLDQWLTKPTDGIFARMNRRISVPISRQLIKLPVTPNMVSLFTLGVGFAAGLFFARGGYWNMLIGALMSVWSSILDGCDGEVARLRLLESDFGCWLETVCDYLYYLFIFAGMAIGLVRNSETKAYLAWSGLLFLGAVTSFLVTGLGRLRLANGRPEQYLKIWQAQAESRRSNPILYIGRHTEFIVRRCFLPYALLFFAVLNIARVAFILSAVGVNVVWLISLYSYRTFAVPRRSLI